MNTEILHCGCRRRNKKNDGATKEQTTETRDENEEKTRDKNEEKQENDNQDDEDNKDDKNGADTVRDKTANSQTWACVESRADR